LKILLTADPHLPVPPQFYGGIERIIATLIASLRLRGHTVGLVAHPDSTAPTDFFVGWSHVLPKSASAHIQNALTLLRASREYGPTLIHSFSRLAYLSPFLWQNVPKIMSYQRPTGGRQIRIAASIGRSLIFTGCSEFIASMGRNYGGSWHAIPNFVDTDRCEWSSKVAPDAPLVFLSRIERIKGTHFAIEVAKKTHRRLLVAGNHSESGAERKYWDDLIAPELGSNGIEYIGPVDDAAKFALLRSAAAMIVPVQWDEPFGIVFAEALACGTPVISCPRGAVPEIVRDGIEGFLITSIEEACRAVDNIPKIDRAACRRRVESKFSVNTVVQQYETLYRSIIAH
jgi:glycosyltransferase involved in cell wall biosynthesis